MQNTTPLLFKPNDEFRRQANVSGLEDYQALWEFADKDYLQYWSEIWHENSSRGKNRLCRSLMIAIRHSINGLPTAV